MLDDAGLDLELLGVLLHSLQGRARLSPVGEIDRSLARRVWLAQLLVSLTWQAEAVVRQVGSRLLAQQRRTNAFFLGVAGMDMSDGL